MSTIACQIEKRKKKLLLQLTLFMLLCFLELFEFNAHPVMAGQEASLLVYVEDIDGMGTVESSGADFYVKVLIERDKTLETAYIDDTDHITPQWPTGRKLSGPLDSVPVTIELWDYDPEPYDDPIDINPDTNPGSPKELNLIVNMQNRAIYQNGVNFIGNMGEKITIGGDAKDERAKITFAISGDITYTSDIVVSCGHSPLILKQGDNIEFTVDVGFPAADERERTMRALLYVNDKPLNEGYKYEEVSFFNYRKSKDISYNCYILNPDGSTSDSSYYCGNSDGKGFRHLIYTFKNKYDTSKLTIPAEFQYKCNVVDSLDGLISGSWNEVTIGAAEGEGFVTPVLVHGPMGSKIDIVFIPDVDDYPGGADNQDFIDDVEKIIGIGSKSSGFGYFSEKVFYDNQDKFNFWIARVPWDAHCIKESWATVVDSPTAPFAGSGMLSPFGDMIWEALYPFADFGVLLHKTTPACRDKFNPFTRMLTVNMTEQTPPAIHETGHAFGLADEYCCDGGYFTTDNSPNNVYAKPQECKDDAKSLGREEKDCWGFDSDWLWNTNMGDNDVNLSDPKRVDVDETTGKRFCEPGNECGSDRMGVQMEGFGKSDIRRIKYIFNMCEQNNCEEIKKR